MPGKSWPHAAGGGRGLGLAAFHGVHAVLSRRGVPRRVVMGHCGEARGAAPRGPRLFDGEVATNGGIPPAPHPLGIITKRLEKPPPLGNPQGCCDPASCRRGPRIVYAYGCLHAAWSASSCTRWLHVGATLGRPGSKLWSNYGPRVRSAAKRRPGLLRPTPPLPAVTRHPSWCQSGSLSKDSPGPPVAPTCTHRLLFPQPRF